MRCVPCKWARGAFFAGNALKTTIGNSPVISHPALSRRESAGQCGSGGGKARDIAGESSWAGRFGSVGAAFPPHSDKARHANQKRDRAGFRNVKGKFLNPIIKIICHKQIAETVYRNITGFVKLSIA